MKRPKPCFLVLESYWSDELRSRNSVQPFIKGLCDLNGWEFFYRVFDSRNDLALWIDKFGRIRRAGKDKIIYLATHGSPSGRLWTLEQRIPLATLAKLLAGVPSLKALHLGSCNLGRPQILEKLLGGTALDWVAAYAEEVPWLESTALDLLFWNWIYSGAPRPQRFRRLTPEAAAHELYEHYNVAEQMGFQVHYRDAVTGAIRSSWETWAESRKG